MSRTDEALIRAAIMAARDAGHDVSSAAQLRNMPLSRLLRVRGIGRKTLIALENDITTKRLARQKAHLRAAARQERLMARAELLRRRPIHPLERLLDSYVQRLDYLERRREIFRRTLRRAKEAWPGTPVFSHFNCRTYSRPQDYAAHLTDEAMKGSS